MYKFLSSIVIITTLSLGYVAQQAKLLECSYRINNNQKRLCLLIDQNNSLEYNIAHLKSPDSLKRRLAANNINLNTPQNWHNIRLANAPGELTQTGSLKANTYNNAFKVATKRLINIFTPKAEAIAQEVSRP